MAKLIEVKTHDDLDQPWVTVRDLLRTHKHELIRAYGGCGKYDTMTLTMNDGDIRLSREAVSLFLVEEGLDQ